MDEIGFGPDREIGPPSRRRRALTAALAVACAAAVAAGVQHALIAQRSAGQPAALSATPAPLPPKGCPPPHPVWPTLASLPAGSRLGALPVVIDAQFSGRCTAP